MAGYGTGPAERKMMYGNLLVKQVSADTVGGVLRIRALYDEREYRNILYEDVFYSQIDERAAGLWISLAEQISLADYRRTGQRDAVAALLTECGAGSEVFLSRLSSRGYSLFVHYAGKASELLVVAKQLTIS